MMSKTLVMVACMALASICTAYVFDDVWAGLAVWNFCGFLLMKDLK